MTIIVFGANGKVGSRVVAQAVSRGHTVRAFVHSTSQHIVPNAAIQIMQGDAANPADVTKAIDGMDTVINCLGSWGAKTKDVQSNAMRVIIPAMEQHGVKRIVSLTGIDAALSSDRQTLTSRFSRFIFQLFARKILWDGENHVRQLSKSNLNWTVVRSPIMTDQGSGDTYQFTNQKPSPLSTIRRDSVACAMLDIAETGTYVDKAPFLRRG